MGLTATCQAHFTTREKSFLTKHHKFHLVDSGIQKEIGYDKVLATESMMLDQFVQDAKKKGMAMLVYVEGEQVECLRAQASALGFRCRVNDDDTTSLRRTKNGDCLIVTEQRLMRGFDYRSHDHAGIGLFIGKLLDSRRAYIQCCGRVGRQSDLCHRFIDTRLDDTMGYDKRANGVLVNKME